MAQTGRARRILPRYLQWFEPTRAYRFRRLVPQSLRSFIGLTEWTETLSPDLGEARRLLAAHVQRTDRIIALASVGNWPEISDEEIEALASGWWAEWQDDRERALHLPGRPDNLQRRLRELHPSEWALANEAELRRSVQQFIRGPRRLDAIFEPELSAIRRLLDDPKKADRLLHNSGVMDRLLRDCRLFHHALAGTWLAPGKMFWLHERAPSNASAPPWITRSSVRARSTP